MIVKEETPLCIFGVLHSNPLQCFCDMKPEMKKFPKFIVKGIRLVRELLNEYQYDVYTFVDDNEPTSNSLLQHVGFVQLNERVYIWPQQSQLQQL